MPGNTISNPPQFTGWAAPPTLEGTASRGTTDEPWDLWGRAGGETWGISGLYLPNTNTMYVNPRRRTHHDSQVATILDHVHLPTSEAIEDMMPWAAGFRRDAEGELRADVEVPRSAGGMTQALTSRGIRVDTLQHGLDVSPAALWPVVYACRVLGMPEWATVRFSHAPERFAQYDGIRATYNGARRQMAADVDRVFPLEEAYREMSLAGELPEPRFDRGLAESGDSLLDILEEWGATQVNSFETGSDPVLTNIDFHTPLPGDQPIRSSVSVAEGQVQEATVRYGVLEEPGREEPHPTNDGGQLFRLKQLVPPTGVPGSGAVLVNYGDDNRRPRPHLLYGWRPSVAEDREVVRAGEPGGTADAEEFGEFVVEFGEAIREDFADEWVSE